MEWIARIYRHHTKYGIIINYADGSVFTLFNVDGYTKLKELVKQNKDIALPSINQLQFVSCGEIDYTIICNGYKGGSLYQNGRDKEWNF